MQAASRVAGGRLETAFSAPSHIRCGTISTQRLPAGWLFDLSFASKRVVSVSDTLQPAGSGMATKPPAGASPSAWRSSGPSVVITGPTTTPAPADAAGAAGAAGAAAAAGASFSQEKRSVLSRFTRP